MLESSDTQFLSRRKHFADTWNRVGISMLVLLAGCLGWLFWRSPYLANPVFVLGEIEGAGIAKSTLDLSAIMLPIMTLTCFAVLFIVILFGFVVFRVERRYMAIIETLKIDAASVAQTFEVGKGN
ncbi:MAG: hypothetical protein KJ052_21770 [Candidatus Hydrogenedentes bacterium]|nr:hypothetical protein [Candidatus Hydrogenedentota bacterium]